MERKVCTKCLVEKSLDDFNPAKDKPLGRTSHCKTCRNENAKRYHKHRYHNDKSYRLRMIKNTKSYSERPENKIKRVKNQKERKLQDINYHLLCVLRVRLWNALKAKGKSKRTKDLLGCSVSDLKRYLESLFQNGMSWDNYGDWHIDHVRPCASFDLSDPEQQKRCFHYSNLQPLWALDNLKKSSRVEFFKI
jgi:hypothetical protein